MHDEREPQVADQTVTITAIIGNKFCTAADDGEKVHKAVASAIRQGDRVCLSFKGVEDLTSAFLNAAVGQLYGEFSEDKLREVLLPPADATPDDLVLLKRVVERAKDFFKDPERYRRAAQEILGDDDNK
jgi:hypothetical protein